MANNEVGTIQPIAELIERIACRLERAVPRRRGAGGAWLPLDVEALGADLISLAAHKVEGPKGVGALWIRRGTAILPQVHGGTQERYRRAGTENVAGAVGMAAAFELAAAERDDGRRTRCAERETGWRATVLGIEGVELTGHASERLPNSLSVIVRDVGR